MQGNSCRHQETIFNLKHFTGKGQRYVLVFHVCFFSKKDGDLKTHTWYLFNIEEQEDPCC